MNSVNNNTTGAPQTSPQLTPEMEKIVAAAVAQALAQQQTANSPAPQEPQPTPAPAPITMPTHKWSMWLAFKTSLTRYTDFSGRASRSEFWYTALANFIITLILEIVTGLGVWLAVCTGVPGIIVASILGLLLLGYLILMIVPGLAVSVRRMHDTNRSGWAILFYLIPLAGPIIFLIFLLSASSTETKYGQAPAGPVSDDEKAPALVAWLIKVCSNLFCKNLGKTLIYGGGGIALIAATWTGLYYLLAPANPLKPLYEDGKLNEKSFGFGSAAKLNNAYQTYLQGEMEITGYPFVPEIIRTARIEKFNLPVDVLKALVEAGADINATSADGKDTAWNAAYELGDPEIIKYLASAGVTIKDTHPSYGEGCYIYDAIANNKPELIRALVAAGCNVDYRVDENEPTALMIAVNQTNTELVKLLAELKANFNAYFLNGEDKVTVFDLAALKSPEMLALVEELGAIPTGKIAADRLFSIADSGNLEAFNAMKAQGVDMLPLSKMTDKYGYTPLMIAANFAPVDLVKAMIEAGFDVNAQSSNGNTALISGAKRPEILQALLEAGADANIANSEGKTALTRAVGSNAEESIRVLAQSGLDVKGTATGDFSYLTYAAAHNKEKSIRALIECGANPNAKDAGGLSPLRRAMEADQAKAIKVLAELGADTQETNENNANLIFLAAIKGKAKALAQLLELPGADVNAPCSININDAIGYTPLHAAAMAGNAECLKVLLATPGINVNAVCSSNKFANYTPLMYAASKDNTECMKLLLEAPGININTKAKLLENDTYASCLQVAAESGHPEITRMLLETNAFSLNDQKEAAKTAIWHGNNKCAELITLYTPDTSKAQGSTQTGEPIKQQDQATSPAATSTSAENGTGAADELTGLIQALQAKKYSTDVEKLYQRRLLEILPRIAAGESVNTIIENANGTTALHNACGLGELDIVIWLVQNGADTSIKTGSGASVANCIGNDPDGSIRAVIMSIEAEQEGSDALALEELAGIIERINAMKVTSSNKLYRTRLLTLLPLILDGGDVNLTLTETKGNTALHYACGLGDVELVTWLLENGADPNKLTDKGMSPYKCAGGKKVKEIQALLKNYGANP